MGRKNRKNKRQDDPPSGPDFGTPDTSDVDSPMKEVVRGASSRKRGADSPSPGKDQAKKKLFAEAEAEVPPRPDPEKMTPLDSGNDSTLVSSKFDAANPTKEPGTFDLKSRADHLAKQLRMVVAYPENVRNNSVALQIQELFAELGSLLDRALLVNSNLEGQVQALRTVVRTRPVTQQSPPVSATPANQPSQLTYAQRCSLPARVTALSRTIRDPPQVVTVVPKDTKAFESSEATKKAVTSLVSPAETKLQVRRIRSIQGNGILIEAAKGSSLAGLTASQKLMEAGLVVGAPPKKSPRVIIYDVPRTVEDSQVVNSILEQNPGIQSKDQEIIQKQTRVAFKTGARDKDTRNVILDASREARDVLKKVKCAYIGWHCCRMDDYVVATRCYKCQSFGHTTKYCRAEKEVCGHCAALGHSFKNCPNKSQPAVCPNCRRSGKDHHHEVTSRDCPSYHQALDQVVSKIDYV